jgi:hypothetical protein
MTTIKSTATEGRTLTVHHIADHITGEAEYLLDINDESRTSEGAIYVKVPELLDALGAVAKGSQWGELAEQLHAATQRAEAAEAEALEQASLVRTFADRAEAAEAKLAEAERDLRLVRAEVQQIKLLEAEEHKRAEAAEAAVQRVRDLDWFGHYSADYVRGLIAKALDPVPPFTLPTTVPATIKATNKGDGRTVRLDLWTDGDGSFVWDTSAYGRYTPEGVLEHFTGHRLIGADE